MKIWDIRKLLIFSFAFLGPLGNLLTPHILPTPFRSYYFLLPAFPLFFWQFRAKQLKVLILFAPFLFYCCLSAFCVELFGEPTEPFPLFRFFLLLFNLCFVVAASLGPNTLEETVSLLNLYLKSFFVSLGIGYFFYLGFYSGFLSFPLLERFSVLTQFGYGLLRFSPGSYPNEYGTLASFVLSILTLHLVKPCYGLYLKKKQTLFLFALTFIALLLTTTRSAFIGYLFSLFYICFTIKRFLKILKWLAVSIVSVFILFKCFGINFFQILISGFSFASFQDGSAAERLLHWHETFENFKLDPYFGTGFASLTNLHNVYLQLLFEMGIFGLLILLGTFILWVSHFSFSFLKKCNDPHQFFFRSFRALGLIQILWFAISNHNLNHHLTWFILFLFIKEFQENSEKAESIT